MTVAMKVLFYGAGVIGSLYAARLKESGQDVSILARGDRLANIRGQGVVLEDVLSGRRTTTSLNVVERLSPEDSYDLVVVCVGKQQLSSVLPALAANRLVPKILFMLNNPEGLKEAAGSVGKDRVLGGFPGAGGSLHEGTIRYLMIDQQSTVLGEPDGRKTPRLQEIGEAFRGAGFPVEITGNVDALLKTHAIFITCIEAAIHLAGGDNQKLAESQTALIEMVEGVREGFRALQALHIPVTPFKLKLMFMWMPSRYPVGYWRSALRGKLGEYSLAAHANASVDEVVELIREVRKMVRDASVPTPAMDRLYAWVDAWPQPPGDQ